MLFIKKVHSIRFSEYYCGRTKENKAECREFEGMSLVGNHRIYWRDSIRVLLNYCVDHTNYRVFYR